MRNPIDRNLDADSDSTLDIDEAKVRAQPGVIMFTDWLSLHFALMALSGCAETNVQTFFYDSNLSFLFRILPRIS